MRAEVEAEYRAKLRQFMAEKGQPVEAGSVEQYGTCYGWRDYEAGQHIRPYDRTPPGCSWVVPEGAELVEESYSMFQDTDADNRHEVGINVSPCHCACGKHTDVTLRYVGSLADVLHSILGIPDQAKLVL